MVFALSVTICSVLLYSCKLGRFVIYNFANITDYKIFPYRTITRTGEPFIFPTAQQAKSPDAIYIDEQEQPFETFLAAHRTVAFLVIQHDSIKYEQYFAGYDKESVVASFSMAKSITSLLIGIAIDEGYIKSVDEPITRYVPELSASGFDAVTIRHLLQMTSGLDFNEGYSNPFGHVATFYYGTNLRRAIEKLKLAEAPGQKFKYTSGQTQLLGLVLERALKTQTISSYLERKVWQPLGMEFDATWSLDRKKNGLEKTFCCVNARARDFAKLGRLYLKGGQWNGKTIVSENWIKESTKVDSSDGSAWHYQYQWWLPTKDGDFLADGLLGQYIYVNPKKDLIIVRLGEKTGKVDWQRFLPQIARAY